MDNHPHLFTMIRHADATGVSGTGRVLDGVVFPDGQTVVRWSVPGKPLSTEIYATFAEFMTIHVDSHPTNGTDILWLHDAPPPNSLAESSSGCAPESILT